MNEMSKENKDLKTAQNKGSVLKRLVMAKCDTCDYWMKDDIPEDSMPYCVELKYWISIKAPVIVPADFGCIRHSSVVE